MAGSSPVAPALETADRVEIHELAARYGFMVDDRNWDALETVFTDAAVFVIKFADGERGIPVIHQFINCRHAVIL